MDTKDWDGFRELFTPDVVIDVSGDAGGVFEGVDAFLAMLVPTLADVETVHHGHMPEIELTSPIDGHRHLGDGGSTAVPRIGADLVGPRLRPLPRHVCEVGRRPLEDRVEPPRPGSASRSCDIGAHAG